MSSEMMATPDGDNPDPLDGGGHAMWFNRKRRPLPIPPQNPIPGAQMSVAMVRLCKEMKDPTLAADANVQMAELVAEDPTITAYAAVFLAGVLANHLSTEDLMRAGLWVAKQ